MNSNQKKLVMIITLNSVGCVFDTKTELTYPQYKNGKIDKSDGMAVHIEDVSPSFLENMSNLDKLQMFNYKIYFENDFWK